MNEETSTNPPSIREMIDHPKNQWAIIQNYPEKAIPRFSVVGGDVAFIMNTVVYALAPTKQMAEDIAGALNGLLDADVKQPGDYIEPAQSDGKRYDGKLFYSQKFAKEFIGSVLTLIEATTSDEKQKAALKKLVKKEARVLLSKLWDVHNNPEYALMAEQEPEDEELAGL